jgi:signal transduction histidine kinase
MTRPPSRLPWPTLVRDAVPPAALAIVLLLASHWQAPHAPTPQVADALGVLAALSLVLRRPWPVATLALSVVTAAAYLLLGNPPGPILLAPFVAALHLVAYRRLSLSLPAAAGAGVVLAVAHVRTAGPAPDAIFLAIWIGAAALFAAIQGVRTAFAAEAQAGREWAEKSRDEAARRRLAEERLRMAREVHDVVGHSLAVITLQAGVADHLLDSQPDKARTALGAIREVSRQALGELRAELASLRGETATEAVRAPAAGLGGLGDLVAGMRAAGLDVAYQTSVAEARVPEAVGQAAYRIVQESLTNVVRHAGEGAGAQVTVGITDGMLRVEVADTGRGAQAEVGGSGLEGMRERAEALGGHLDAGDRPQGGFVVRAELPLRSPGAPAP